jgi:anti-sigma regulatory factor (Ser/Thr protein kinase)
MTGLQARFERSMLPTPEATSELTDEVMAFLDQHGVEVRVAHHTALVLSEVLTNLATHGHCPDQPARVAVTVEPGQVSGEIVDKGSPFDPRQAPDPDLDAAAADRPIGGLGLYLVRKLSCSLEYARRNDENCMTFAIRRGGTAQGN